MASTKLYIGVDIGKTKIAAALVSESGALSEKRLDTTDLSNGGERVMTQANSLISDLIEAARGTPKGIGISAIGAVDASQGVVRASSIPALCGVNVRGQVSEKFGLPVSIDNDLHCPAFGEYTFGASSGSNLAVYLTISSGVGISTIANGKILHGSHYLAGFIGNAASLPDGKELETKFSGIGISESASRLMGKGITTAEAFDLAKDRLSPVHKVIEEAEYHASAMVASVQMMIDPEIIVVGGGVAINQPHFVKEIKGQSERMLGRARVQLPNGINMVISKLGQYNGVMGAAALAMQKLNGQ